MPPVCPYAVAGNCCPDLALFRRAVLSSTARPANITQLPQSLQSRHA
jgi:hypothetical protein